jgi:radical SAM protein
MTRACDLACRHCRALATPERDPEELSSDEGRRLLAALRAFGDPAPAVVLTGGDPLKRPDFWDLLAHGIGLGLDVAVAPSGTPTLTPEVVARVTRAGVRAMSLSLDAATPERHDALRGVPGSFARTLAAARSAVGGGISLQVNTLVSRETRADLAGVADLVAGLGAARWSLFFLIAVGRGRVLEPLDPPEAEGVLEWLAGLAGRVPFVATTTEAPHFRRVVLQRRAGAAPGPRPGAHPGRGPAAPPGHAPGIRDGNGILFVSHRGELQPSGFLPLVAGRFPADDPVAVYRDAPLFRALRRPETFGSRCGRCEFREVCGGSRARAFAAGGDPLGDDPLCPYEPGAARAGPS